MEAGVKEVKGGVVDKRFGVLKVFNGCDESDALMIEWFFRSGLDSARVDFRLHCEELVFDIGE
jgi:hypothetical protein